jgi:hypothetical protein
MSIIAVSGFIGSGKGFFSDYLQSTYKFKHISFAESLKKSISEIFGWDYELLKGTTSESREWREQIDPWWSKRLDIPNLTPRLVLQIGGTDLWRNGFHQDIWIASLERKLQSMSNDNIVIDDCRFPNEFKTLHSIGATIVKITRGNNPEWYNTAFNELSWIEERGYETGWESPMQRKYPNIHYSEWAWITQHFDKELYNNGNKDEFINTIDEFMKTL